MSQRSTLPEGLNYLLCCPWCKSCLSLQSTTERPMNLKYTNRENFFECKEWHILFGIWLWSFNSDMQSQQELYGSCILDIITVEEQRKVHSISMTYVFRTGSTLAGSYNGLGSFETDSKFGIVQTQSERINCSFFCCLFWIVSSLNQG